MAERLDSLPRRRRRTYPWEQWADGGVWLLVRGEDYTVHDHSMYTAARAHALASGMTVSVQRTDRGVAVQFFKPAPAKRPFKRHSR